MEKSEGMVARRIAQAASAFEQQRTGHVPRSVSVILQDNTLVVTLHEALSPAERVLARSPAGAAQVQEFHRRLFAASSGWLRQQIEKITGVEVREAAAEVETASAMVKVFTTGTVVEVFLLAQDVPADTWSGSNPSDP